VIAEQVGEVGAEKGPVRREVVRIVTPGTATDDSLLDPRTQNWLGAVARVRNHWGLAFLELSTGRFSVLQTAEESDLLAELHRVRPSELLLPDTDQLDIPTGDSAITRRPPWHFEVDSAYRLLLEQFKTRDLRGFGCEELRAAIAAAGALLQYVQETQKALLPHLSSLRVETPDETLILDPSTRRNLEIDRSLSGQHDFCLLNVLDSTVTPMGSRQLARWMLRPLRDRAELRSRHDAISLLLAEWGELALRESLQGVADVERIVARIALRSARPRDLSGLRDSLTRLPAVVGAARAVDSARLNDLALDLGNHASWADRLQRALIENPPLLARDGGVFAVGYDETLDELRQLSENADGFLMELEARERASSGIDALKVGYNRVHGFYIEISKLHAAKVPQHYTRRQTLTNAERYITEELKQFEDKVLSARDRALAREKWLYDDLLERLAEELPALQACARALSELDALACLAERARALDLKRPDLVDEPVLDIRAGRHPVVEQTLKHPFVPNDLHLDDARRLLVITGPNMGGKSTYMRQTALIVLMACAGSFIPAESARIGPIDRIFTRIGASDDLASGHSTFMVEMTETANILHHASAQSLVLMDEIGRGTSTYDGLSLARAVAEHLASKVGAYTLFATHYFELTQLDRDVPTVANAHLDAVEHGDQLVFLHHVKDGPANRSFGLQVAQLAGVPAPVIRRARNVLAQLEQQAAQHPANQAQMGLFDAPPPVMDLPEPEPSASDLLLTKLDPDSLTPREALDALYRLKALLPKDPG